MNRYLRVGGVEESGRGLGMRHNTVVRGDFTYMWNGSFLKNKNKQEAQGEKILNILVVIICCVICAFLSWISQNKI